MILLLERKLTIDCSEMPVKDRYEDTYGQYLDIFKAVAEADIDVQVTARNVPYAWVPLLRYLGAHVASARQYFEDDTWMYYVWNSSAWNTPSRVFVEVMCGFRPECVDALWKCDMEWNTKRVRSEGMREFIVTNNGSFHRPEVLNYINSDLHAFEPTKRKAVLVPCAADKPYPALLHSAVQRMLPDDWHIITATGVLGLVPQELWDVMPYYDSGLPNEWRLYNTVKDYFSSYVYERVISYTDFYSYAINEGFMAIGQSDVVEFVDPPIRRNGYLNLLDEGRLAKLGHLINGTTGKENT